MNGDAVAQPEELLETMSEATAMVAAGKYPSPPARALNLVTNGQTWRDCTGFPAMGADAWAAVCWRSRIRDAFAGYSDESLEKVK